MRLRAVLMAAALAAGTAGTPAVAGASGTDAPATARAENRTPSPVPDRPAASDADRYAEREQAASQLESFEGGDRVIVGISGGTVLLVVLLVLLLV